MKNDWNPLVPVVKALTSMAAILGLLWLVIWLGKNVWMLFQ